MTASTVQSSVLKAVTPFAVLLLCVIGMNAPFLNQPFHMDDGIYLLMARNVYHNPWFPQDRPVLFEGLYGKDLASTEHPWPLTSYVMALCSRAGGFSEPCLHLGFVIFPVVLSFSMYSIARRFMHHPLLAGITVVAMPVVCVLSHTLMTDIPLLALWLAAVALFVRGVDKEKRSHIWIATASATLACLVSYSGFCLIPLLALYGMLRRNRSAAVVALLFPAAVFGFWTALNYVHYHRVTPGLLLGSYLFAKRVLAPGLVAEKSVYVLLVLGGTTVFPPFLIALGRKKALVTGLAAAVAAGLLLRAHEYGWLGAGLFVIFFWGGFAAISEVAHVLRSPFAGLKGNSRAADDLFLGLWAGGMLVFCALAYMNGSARYVLPAIPPLIVIIFRRLERAQDGTRLRRFALANIVASGAFALLLSSADYQHATVYRDFASGLKRPRRGGNLWFAGEWGLRAYLESIGGLELGRGDARPNPGDMLVVPTLATPYRTLLSDVVDFDSTVIIAPSRLIFEIPYVLPGSDLVYVSGMPFHPKSDGLDFSIRFVSQGTERLLLDEHISPDTGRRWSTHVIPLDEIAGRRGSIVFSADVGAAGNADADWIALAHARICRRGTGDDPAQFDFYENLQRARLEPVPSLQYHTKGNLSALRLVVWLEQEPATVLRERHEYRPAIPLRLLDPQCHAGFWSSGFGLLPFSLTTRRSMLETISVYEVIRRVDGYGESTPSWYAQ